jgi:5-oxoprolinase (ATP-hydrolysing) subunit A
MTNPLRIDLAADLGEAFGSYRMGDDEGMLDIVTSANIACGFHAGDPRIMDRTVEACVARGVAVGAHPGFADLVGFGRRAMDLSPNEVRTDVLYQIGALEGFARVHGATLHHVAPHGKLANMAVVDRTYADAVAEAIAAFDDTLVVLTYAGELAECARRRGLQVAIAGFADRAYVDDGTLLPRSEPGAVITDADEVVARGVRMATEGLVRSARGYDVPVKCDSIVVHGDTPGAVALSSQLKQALNAAGVDVVSLRHP